jgi:hypothetical protein
MPVTINGTTGVVTPGATIGSINGILKSSSGVVSQASVGTDYSQLTLATAQTASGTAVDFTGIPSWAKRITVMFNNVSTNGTSGMLIQIGTGGTPTTSGYFSNSSLSFTTQTAQLASTAGFVIFNNNIATTNYGNWVINNVSGNNWVASGVYTALASQTGITAGGILLSGVLNIVRITTVNGTDTFDAGTINISYE